MRSLITTFQAAARHGVAANTVRLWCRQGKVRGAVRISRDWMIPAKTTLPEVGVGGRRTHRGNSDGSEHVQGG